MFDGFGAPFTVGPAPLANHKDDGRMPLLSRRPRRLRNQILSVKHTGTPVDLDGVQRDTVPAVARQGAVTTGGAVSAAQRRVSEQLP